MMKYKCAMSEDIENLIALKTATNFSEETYTSRAKEFDAFCAEKFPNVTIITESLSMAWANDALENKNRNAAHSRIAFLRLLGTYQKAIGKKNAYIPPLAMLSGQTLFMPYIFTDKELSALFDAIDSYQSKAPLDAISFSTYFRLIYTCGLRPQEGRLIKRADVIMESGEIRILNSKWHKSRIVVMSEDMTHLMARYIAIRDIAFPDSEYLFTARSGGPYTADRMQSSFKKFFELSCPDIPKELLPAVRVYDLRHRFATAVLHKWINQGCDIQAKLPYLQVYMGHKKMQSTAYYIHLLPENLTKTANIDWESLNAIVPEVEAWEEE